MKKYIFQDYSQQLPILFEQEKKRLQKQLKNVRIEHVGSTAVPQLDGKEIILQWARMTKTFLLLQTYLNN